MREFNEQELGVVSGGTPARETDFCGHAFGCGHGIGLYAAPGRGSRRWAAWCAHLPEPKSSIDVVGATRPQRT